MGLILTTETQRAVHRYRLGFTVVELLLVAVVLGILVAVTVVAYRGMQNQANDLKRRDDIKTVEAALEYYATHHDGLYPATTANAVANWKTVDVRTDSNCFNGSSQTDWVPELEYLSQSTPNTGWLAGVDGSSGCYLYASNGTHYVLSFWNMLATPQADSSLYRRLGFRTFQTSTSTQFYSCNHNVTGGANGAYDAAKDYYKHSYTISNITDCDETPPPGA